MEHFLQKQNGLRHFLKIPPGTELQPFVMARWKLYFLFTVCIRINSCFREKPAGSSTWINLNSSIQLMNILYLFSYEKYPYIHGRSNICGNINMKWYCNICVSQVICNALTEIVRDIFKIGYYLFWNITSYPGVKEENPKWFCLIIQAGG